MKIGQDLLEIVGVQRLIERDVVIGGIGIETRPSELPSIPSSRCIPRPWRRRLEERMYAQAVGNIWPESARECM